MKAFGDDNFSRAHMVQFLFDRLENIVGKGENASNQQFLLIPQCLQTALSYSHYKQALCGKVLKANTLCRTFDSSILVTLPFDLGGLITITKTLYTVYHKCTNNNV